jgi:hypothetical protein
MTAIATDEKYRRTRPLNIGTEYDGSLLIWRLNLTLGQDPH